MMKISMLQPDDLRGSHRGVVEWGEWHVTLASFFIANSREVLLGPAAMYFHVNLAAADLLTKHIG